MKKEIKELSSVLQVILEKRSLLFLMENMEDGEDTKNILDLILSSHLSACFSCMKLIASQHKNMLESVEKFIEEFYKMLTKIDSIIKVEISYGK